jgi:hypothetical protein
MAQPPQPEVADGGANVEQLSLNLLDLNIQLQTATLSAYFLLLYGTVGQVSMGLEQRHTNVGK